MELIRGTFFLFLLSATSYKIGETKEDSHKKDINYNRACLDKHQLSITR